MAKVKYSFAQWCRDNEHEDWLDLWDCELNDCSPEDVSYGSAEKCWFKCNCKNHPSFSRSIFVYRKSNKCPVCTSHKIIAGINDIATTNPECLKYFLDINDAHKYSAHSTKRCLFRCPICGAIKESYIYNVVEHGFSCDACSDSMSFPEKFVYNLLMQIKSKREICFKKEMTFEWSKNVCGNRTHKDYDFYIYPPYNILIEVNGGQHYFDTFKTISGARTLKEEQENDALKYSLAINNGISKDHYIVIDARFSDKDYIMSSILKSNLLQLMNVQSKDIDWEECSNMACKSLVKECCDLWNNGLKSTFFIGEKLNLSYTLVNTYLKQGSNAGLCMLDNNSLYLTSKRKPILCIENNYIFESVRLCADISNDLFGIKMNHRTIACAASGDRNSAYGYHFKYITKEEFLQIQRSDPSHAFGEVYFYDINDPKGENLIF